MDAPQYSLPQQPLTKDGDVESNPGPSSTFSYDHPDRPLTEDGDVESNPGPRLYEILMYIGKWTECCYSRDGARSIDFMTKPIEYTESREIDEVGDEMSNLAEQAIDNF